MASVDDDVVYWVLFVACLDIMTMTNLWLVLTTPMEVVVPSVVPDIAACCVPSPPYTAQRVLIPDVVFNITTPAA